MPEGAGVRVFRGRLVLGLIFRAIGCRLLLGLRSFVDPFAVDEVEAAVQDCLYLPSAHRTAWAFGW
jgi:hypothetical protein